MKRLASVLIITMAVSLASGSAVAGEQAPQEVIDLAHSTLAELGTDPIIVKAVIAANAKGMSLEDIKKMDAEWKAHAGVADYMQKMIDSDCGLRLAEILESASYYAEIFVMDNQGGNVAMTDKTSDYWQGDEAKFQKSYNEGAGNVFVDEVEFDDSTQAYLVQISVPVVDGDKVIGAICVGIDIDLVEQEAAS